MTPNSAVCVRYSMRSDAPADGEHQLVDMSMETWLPYMYPNRASRHVRLALPSQEPQELRLVKPFSSGMAQKRGKRHQQSVNASVKRQERRKPLHRKERPREAKRSRGTIRAASCSVALPTTTARTDRRVDGRSESEASALGMTTNALHRQTRRRHFSTWCQKPLSCFDPGSTMVPDAVRCM